MHVVVHVCVCVCVCVCGVVKAAGWGCVYHETNVREGMYVCNIIHTHWQTANKRADASKDMTPLAAPLLQEPMQ